MNDRVAITGSTGMLGSHLVAELLGRGYTDVVLPVRSLSRLGSLAATLRREGFGEQAGRMEAAAAGKPCEGPLHPVVAELNDPEALREVFRGVKIVFHCAAVVSLGDADPAEIIETNVELTTCVVDAAISCGVRRLVHTSSIAALGQAPGGKELIDETCELEDLAGTSPYGISKFYSENRAWRGRAEGLEVVVVNPAVILGQGDWHSGGSTLIIPFVASGIPFYTPGAVGYVDVRDVARAQASLATCPEADGERFILSGGNLYFRELITSAALAAGNRPPRIRAGKFLLGLAWRADKFISWIAGRKPQLSRAMAASAATESLYDGSKITRYIAGFTYTPITETIERVVKAYKDEN